MITTLFLIALLSYSSAKPMGSKLKSLTTDTPEVSKGWRELCENPASTSSKSFLGLWLLQDPPEQTLVDRRWQDEAEQGPWNGGAHGSMRRPGQPATSEGTLRESHVAPMGKGHKRPLVSFDHLGPSESSSPQGFESGAMSRAGVHNSLRPVPQVWNTHDPRASKALLAPRVPSPNLKKWNLQDGMEGHSWFHDPGIQLTDLTNPAPAAPGRSSEMMCPSPGQASKALGGQQVYSEPVLASHHAISQGSIVVADPSSQFLAEMAHFLVEEPPFMTQYPDVGSRELDTWIQAITGPQIPGTGGKVQLEPEMQYNPVVEPTNDFAGHSTNWNSNYSAKRQRTSLGSFSGNFHQPLEVFQTGRSLEEKNLDQPGVGVGALDSLEKRRIKNSIMNAGRTSSAESQSPIEEPDFAYCSSPTMGSHSHELKTTGNRKPKPALESTWHDGNEVCFNCPNQLFEPKKPLVPEFSRDIQVPLVTDQSLLSQYLDTFGPDPASLIPPSPGEFSIDTARKSTPSLDNSLTNQNPFFLFDKGQNMNHHSGSRSSYDITSKKSLIIKGSRSSSTAESKANSKASDFHNLKPWEVFQGAISKGGIKEYLSKRSLMDGHPGEKDVPTFIDSLVLKQLKLANKFTQTSVSLYIPSRPLISWLLETYPIETQPEWLKSNISSSNNDTEHFKYFSQIIYQNSIREMMKLGFQKKLEEFFQELFLFVERNSTKPTSESRFNQARRVLSVAHRVVLHSLYCLLIAHQLDSVNLSGTTTNAQQKLDGVFEMLKEFWLNFPFGRAKSKVPTTNPFFKAVNLKALISLNSGTIHQGIYRTEKDLTTYLLKQLFSRGEKQFINCQNSEVSLPRFEKFIKDAAVIDWLAANTKSEGK